MRLSLNWVLGLVLLAGGPVQADTLAAAAAQVAAGDYRAALVTLDGMAETDAAAPQFLRATALAGTGQLEEAAALFERLIAAHPGLPEVYNNLAVLRARQGRLDEAKELLERALRTDERYARVHENLSTVYVEMARSSYAKALRLESGAQPPQLALLTALDAVPQAVPPLPVADAVSAVVPPPAPVTVPAPSAAAVVAVPPEPEPPLQPVSTAPVAAPAPAMVASEPEPASAAPVAAEPAVAEVPEALRLAVVTALEGWARAWSQQNVDAYLAYYDAAYAPEGMSRHAWEEERRSRLSRPAWIKVELEDVQVAAPAPATVVVDLRQRYASPGYKDITLKRMTLALRDGNWMITSETNLKVLR
ncbi:tetratricopeptide repeat protein [Sulfurivermis fontis]|uniref:L,D-transpeptidase Cds6 family protein n=1 Tax=Sulfurivermis fontis TaxID=1972068 RepID=UPI000FD953B8|nr:tetratricopeptide repeat protein [Sulfurivermis fontis]